MMILPGETAHQALGRLMRLADEGGYKFTDLELYQIFSINRNKFVRLRTDLELRKLHARLLEEGRGIILPTGDVSLPNGQKGKYSLSLMHATPSLSDWRKYRGTRDKFWERQFE